VRSFFTKVSLAVSPMGWFSLVHCPQGRAKGRHEVAGRPISAAERMLFRPRIGRPSKEPKQVDLFSEVNFLVSGIQYTNALSRAISFPRISGSSGL